jgi:hypothetical protein
MPLAHKRARRAPDVYASSSDSLRPFCSALDRRSSKVLGMVADPSIADALTSELNALADAHPELMESVAMLQLAGRTLLDQKAEVVRLRNTLDEVKKELQDNVEMMGTFIVNAHLEDTTLEQMGALTPGERIALASLQGVMLELLDSLNDPELAEVEPDPGSVLFSPTAATPPAAAAPPLAAAASPDPPPVPSPTAAAAAAATPSAAPLAFFSVFYPKKAPEVAAAAAGPLVGAAAAATTTPALSQKAAAGAAAKDGLRVVLKIRNERVKGSTAAAAQKLEELHGQSKVLGTSALDKIAAAFEERLFQESGPCSTKSCGGLCSSSFFRPASRIQTWRTPRTRSSVRQRSSLRIS